MYESPTQSMLCWRHGRDQRIDFSVLHDPSPQTAPSIRCPRHCGRHIVGSASMQSQEEGSNAKHSLSHAVWQCRRSSSVKSAER